MDPNDPSGERPADTEPGAGEAQASPEPTDEAQASPDSGAPEAGVSEASASERAEAEQGESGRDASSEQDAAGASDRVEASGAQTGEGLSAESDDEGSSAAPEEGGGQDDEAAPSDDAEQDEDFVLEETRAPEPAAQIPNFPEPPRKRHHVAPALVALDHVLDDETFRIRPAGELTLLATDIARLGQLFPVDLRLVPPNGFQVVAGFRRVAALRFLQRDKVLARLHTDLDDEDALLMALAAAIHSVPVAAEELSALKDRLEGQGLLSAAARDMLEKALTVGEALAPEGPMVEIDADELAVDVTRRLGAINQDLALLADVFGSLDEAQRAELLDQLRYSSELVAFLEGQG